MRALRLLVAISTVLVCSIVYAEFGLWHNPQDPNSPLTDIQSSPLVGMEAEGISVTVNPPIPQGVPLLYDPVNHLAIPNQALIDARQAQAQEEAQAATDCGMSKPVLRNRIVQDLVDIQQEMDRAQEVQDQMIAQLAAFGSDPALPASPTTAQLKTAFNTLSTRYQQSVTAMRDVAVGSKRSGDRFRGIAKLVACQAGIHIPS